MRDLYVEIPGHGYNKLNAANSFGGIELLYKTIAKNFNIELDGYVEIGFKAFQDIVDAVGGVEVELTESEVSYLNSTNYIRNKKYRDVKAGKLTLRHLYERRELLLRHMKRPIVPLGSQPLHHFPLNQRRKGVSNGVADHCKP